MGGMASAQSLDTQQGSHSKLMEEIKSFSDKQKLGEFSTTKSALQQMLKRLIHSKNTREEKGSTKSTPKY